MPSVFIILFSIIIFFLYKRKRDQEVLYARLLRLQEQYLLLGKIIDIELFMGKIARRELFFEIPGYLGFKPDDYKLKHRSMTPILDAQNMIKEYEKEIDENIKDLPFKKVTKYEK